jgi:hypothetical protein
MRTRRTRSVARIVVTYIVRQGDAGGPVKVGKTSDLAGRLRELQTASSEQLHLLDVVAADIERGLHQHLARFHRAGEWFSGDVDCLEEIAGYVQSYRDATWSRLAADEATDEADLAAEPPPRRPESEPVPVDEVKAFFLSFNYDD